MHIECCGSGEAILFIHGMPTNGRLWKRTTENLCANFRCFTIDLPGLGKSPSEPYGPLYFESLAQQIEALRLAQGVERWHVVGHDAGSVVAVHYAHAYPESVNCLALLSPALFPELKPFFLIEPLRHAIVGELLAPFIRAAFWKVAMHRALDGSAQNQAAVADFYQPFAGVAGPWKFMRLLRWGKPSQVLAQVPGFLPQLLMPTLILHGTQDVAIPESFARRALSLIPNARLTIVDCGHFIPLREPVSVASSLATFFNGQPAAMMV